MASDGAAGDEFGHSVAISDHFVAVGAWRADVNGRSDAGAVYLYDAGTGHQLAIITPNDGEAGDTFGVSVAIRDQILVIGATGDDDNGSQSGSVYVFDISNPQHPTQLAKLKPHDGAPNAAFGNSVSISGQTILIGAYLDDDGHGPYSGAAYLFDRSTFAELSKISAVEGAYGDWFGWSVAIDGNLALMGARNDDDWGTDSGSAYLYDVSDPAHPALASKIDARDAAAGNNFGYSVAVRGATALVGALHHEDVGAAYLFDLHNPVHPAQSAKLVAEDAQVDARLGCSVSLNGNAALVGAYVDDNQNGENAGAAYLFDAVTGAQIDKITAQDMNTSFDQFGFAAALSDNGTAVISAVGKDDRGPGSGSGYLFTNMATHCVPTLSAHGSCPLPITYVVQNATPNENVALCFGFGRHLTIPDIWPCAGMTLDVGNPHLSFSIIYADSDGQARLGVTLPPSACARVRVQAVDITTCQKSNVIAP